MMTIALKDDLQRLLRDKVEKGEFPNEEAVVEEALKCFLIPELFQGRWPTHSQAEILAGRLPGPFIEDETALAPVELPRTGREIARSHLLAATRRPTLFPGE